MLERDGEGRKDKGGCEGSRSKKSCMWRVVYKGLKRRAHWRAHTAQIRTFFSCTANGNCGARDFFPRWVKTIREVPGSNASDMQQCGNSEAIRSEINSCDGSLLCKVTIKSFADTILYVCCCYYVWLFDGLSTCADHEPQQWDSSSVHRILSQSNPHTTIHNTTERNYCNASISAKLAARTKNTWQNTWQQDNHEYANHIYKYHMRKQAVQRTQPKWHEPSAPMLLPTLNQSHLHRTEMQARPVLPPVARCPWMRKERYRSAKLIELPWWQTLTTGKELNETSSLARTCGTNTHPFFFCTANVNCGARDFFLRWVKIETRRFNWWDKVYQHQCCIADHHLQWCIGVWVPKEDYSCARVPYEGSSRYQCKRPHAEASLDSRL